MIRVRWESINQIAEFNPPQRRHVQAYRNNLTPLAKSHTESAWMPRASDQVHRQSWGDFRPIGRRDSIKSTKKLAENQILRQHKNQALVSGSLTC